MKQVAVSELKDKAIVYLTGNEPLEIQHNGHVIGFYYPKKPINQAEVELAVERLSQAVKKALDETGMTEDEFADLFDTSKPFPYDNPSDRH